MRMMSCVASQGRDSQMNLLLHGSVWLQSMDSNPSASSRAYGIMRMMSCVGRQSSVSQMNFLLHGSVWLQSMDSNPSASCRVYECVVEHKTVQHSNGFYYIIRCSSILFVPLCCSLFDSYNPDCFEATGSTHKTIIVMFWVWKQYNAMRAFAEECTRHTHPVSCGMN